MSAREIWRCANCDRLFNSDENCTCDRPYWDREASQADLTSAGYRILAPVSLDPETLESAAKSIETLTVPGYHPDDLYTFRDITALAAAAIRVMGGGRE